MGIYMFASILDSQWSPACSTKRKYSLWYVYLLNQVHLETIKKKMVLEPPLIIKLCFVISEHFPNVLSIKFLITSKKSLLHYEDNVKYKIH